MPEDKNAALMEIRETMRQAVAATCLGRLGREAEESLLGGKMLRARLAVALAKTGGGRWEQVRDAAAAVELAHAASLLHDDVIDGAFIRRAMPSFWKHYGVSGAILSGDTLVCQAMAVIARQNGLARRFAAKICEVVDAEVEQELRLRGALLDDEQARMVARRKTGALFALAARCAANGVNSPLAASLEEAGYRLGAAYQLADDLLDWAGDEALAGKSLGSDERRGKRSRAAAEARGDARADRSRQWIKAELAAADAELEGFPESRRAAREYVSDEFLSLPAFALALGNED